MKMSVEVVRSRDGSGALAMAGVELVADDVITGGGGGGGKGLEAATGAAGPTGTGCTGVACALGGATGIVGAGCGVCGSGGFAEGATGGSGSRFDSGTSPAGVESCGDAASDV